MLQWCRAILIPLLYLRYGFLNSDFLSVITGTAVRWRASVAECAEDDAYVLWRCDWFRSLCRAVLLLVLLLLLLLLSHWFFAIAECVVAGDQVAS